MAYVINRNLKKIAFALLITTFYVNSFGQNVTLHSILKDQHKELAFRPNFYALTTCLRDYQAIAITYINGLDSATEVKKKQLIINQYSEARSNVNGYLINLASCLNDTDNKNYKKFNHDLKKTLNSIKNLYNLLEVNPDLSSTLGLDKKNINDLIKYTMSWEFEILNCTESGKNIYKERLMTSRWIRFEEINNQ